MAVSHSSGNAGSFNHTPSTQRFDISAGSSAPDCSPASVFMSHAQQSHANLPPSAACHAQPEPPNNAARLAAFLNTLRLDLYRAGNNAGNEQAAKEAIEERSKQQKENSGGDKEAIARIKNEVLQETQEVRRATLATADSLSNLKSALCERDNASRNLKDLLQQTYVVHPHSSAGREPLAGHHPAIPTQHLAPPIANSTIPPLAIGTHLPAQEFARRGLQDSLTTAKTHFVQADAQLRDNLKQELYLRYEWMNSPTPAERGTKKAADAVMAIHPELIAYPQYRAHLMFYGDAFNKEVDLRSRIKRIILDSDDTGMPKWLRDLARTDPVTLAVIQELGIEDTPATNAEIALATLAPMAFALLKYAGGSLPENAGIFGMMLTDKEIIVRTRNIIAKQLANLARAEPEKMRQLQILTEASGSARTEWVTGQIAIILQNDMAADMALRTQSNTDKTGRLTAGEEALQLIKTQIDRCYTFRQVAKLWQAIETPLRDYIHAQTDYLSDHHCDKPTGRNDAEPIGNWLKGMSKFAIPPTGSLLIDAVISRFDAHILSQSASSSVRAGLQIAIDKAPHRASDITLWMQNAISGDYAESTAWRDGDIHLSNMTFMSPTEDGDGKILAQTIIEHVHENEGAERAEALKSAYNERIQDVGVNLNNRRNEMLYQRFMESPEIYIQTMFDGLIQAKPHLYGIEHNISGRCKKDRQLLLREALTPINGGIPYDAAAIEQVDSWILDHGGADARISFVPTIYADKRGGVAGLPLICLRKNNSKELLIDASMADLAARGHNVPWKYESLSNFIEENMLAETGRLYMTNAPDLLLQSNSQGHAEITVDGIAAASEKPSGNARFMKENAIAAGGILGGICFLTGTDGFATPIILSNRFMQDAEMTPQMDTENQYYDQLSSDSVIATNSAWLNFIGAYAGNLWIGRL